MLFSQFYRSKDQRYYINWTKETVFVSILGFIFYGVFFQKLIYIINILFNFVFGSFFEQDHLLIFFISGVYVKR